MYSELVTERPLPSPDVIPLHVNYAVVRLNRFGTDWSRRDDLDAALSSLTELEASDLTDAPPGTANAIRAHLIQALSARYQLAGDEADQARIDGPARGAGRLRRSGIGAAEQGPAVR